MKSNEIKLIPIKSHEDLVNLMKSNDIWWTWWSQPPSQPAIQQSSQPVSHLHMLSWWPWMAPSQPAIQPASKPAIHQANNQACSLVGLLAGWLASLLAVRCVYIYVYIHIYIYIHNVYICIYVCMYVYTNKTSLWLTRRLQVLQLQVHRSSLDLIRSH